MEEGGRVDPIADEEKRRLVLVVDDTALIRQMARDTLEGEGLEVVEAVDGEAALSAFAARRPDLVLLDVQMPRRDGFSVCEEIRRSSGGETLPVLMLTSCDDVASIERAYDCGATDFMTKPVNWVILAHRVRYMLRMSEVVREFSRSQQRLERAQRSARLGDWQIDLRSEALSCSDVFLELYGLAGPGPSVELGRVLRTIHPEDQELVRAATERAIGQGTGFDVDHRVCVGEDEERHVHVRGGVVLDAEGEVVGLTGTAQDVTDWRRAESEALRLAYHDGLTGIGNRRLFRERLEFALAQARRLELGVGVLLMDLDRFKHVNDAYGYDVGDMLLQHVAERLTNCVRDGDVVSRSLPESPTTNVSRFGGDEFMISLSCVRSEEEVCQVAARLLEVINRPFHLHDREIVLSASIGVALSPRDGEDAGSLLRNADTAKGFAKTRGGSRIHMYDTALNELARRTRELQTDLRTALERREFIVHYQPKVALVSGRITGFEALVRWEHSRRGMIAPNDFLPLVEQSGLITQLGEYVLRIACEQARAWREAGYSTMRMSVNFSAQQFRTDTIAETVAGVLRDTPMSPRCLDIEITESTMMENQALAVTSLQRMKGTGITVSLDDFGTGYSSLSYLKGFPIDTLKVDRSFICDIPADPDSASITAAIVSMAHTLNLGVVAEGVETPEQLAFLRDCGCDEAQGFLFSRPLSADAATELLREGRSLLEPEAPSAADD